MTRRQDELWYTYDKANRFTITMGELNGARATSSTSTATKVIQGDEGIAITYDAAGQRQSAKSADGVLEDYTYSSDGFLEDTKIGGVLRARRRVDALGRTLEYIEYDAAGANGKTTVSKYDYDNRLVLQSNADGVTKYLYFTDATDNPDSTSQGGPGMLARTEFTPAGEATATTTWYTYQYWDEAKQLTIKKQGFDESTPGWAPGYSNMSYNANGHLKTAYDTGALLTTRFFNSANGQVLRRQRTQNNVTVGTQYYYYADSRRIGDVADNRDEDTRVSYAEELARKEQAPVDRKKLYKTFKPVTSADFDQNYEPINSTYPAATSTSYTVVGGETLQTIARTLWGDAAMWYLLADANGLSGNETLVSGRVLVVPNKVTNIHNNSQTFRPYNPGEVIGNLDPTLPAPPPPPGRGGCGGIAQIVMIVVAVVVTIYTAGAAAALMGAATAATTAGAVAIGAVAGAAGAAASQAAGMAMGVQDKFSWDQVAMGAVGGGVTAGMGAAFAGGAELGAVGRAMAGSVVTQGVSVATGMQSKFSWKSVATAGAAAGVSYAVGDGLSGTELGSDLGGAEGFGTRMVRGMAGTAVAQLVGSGRADPGSVFMNTLGATLGESFGTSLSTETQGEGTGSDRDFREGANVESDDAYTQAAYNQLVDAFGEAEPANTVGIQVASAGGGMGVDPESMESMRGLDGAYRMSIVGTSETPEVYGEGAGAGVSDGSYDAAEMRRFSNYAAPTDEAAQVVEIFGRFMTDAQKATYDAAQLRQARIDGVTDAFADTVDGAQYSYGLKGTAEERGAWGAATGQAAAQGLINFMGHPGQSVSNWWKDFTGNDPAAVRKATSTVAGIGFGAVGGVAAAKVMTAGAPAVLGRLGNVEGGAAGTAATLSRIEGRFAGASCEVGFIVDSESGAILGVRRSGLGNGTQISLDPVRDYPLMQGNVFTHNHPLGGNLSPGDVSTALGSGASEFRAVTSNRTMSISFGNAPEGLIGEPAASVVFMNGEKAAIGSSYRAGVADGSLLPPLNPAAKNIWLSDYFMQELTARNPWINYSVTPR